MYLDFQKEQEKLTQDILHKMEDEKTKNSERNKLATKLAICRRDRRYYKDRVQELEPMIKFIQENRKMTNVLKQVLGEVRKIERYHADRTYYPRVMRETHGVKS